MVTFILFTSVSMPLEMAIIVSFNSELKWNEILKQCIEMQQIGDNTTNDIHN